MKLPRKPENFFKVAKRIRPGSKMRKMFFLNGHTPPCTTSPLVVTVKQTCSLRSLRQLVGYNGRRVCRGAIWRMELNMQLY